jgi:F420-dependent oxidoreductase-like protein
MKQCAQRAEAAGYESLWLYDHFHTIPEALPTACFEVWTATAALAEATSRIRLGQMCGCNIYRPPALLAKITANIDVISGGRLEVGIGAGWYEHECVAYGYPFEKPSERIGALDEAVQILKGMWTQDRFQFEGKHYQIGLGEVHNYRGQKVELEGAYNHPKPLQSPHPPLWIAGGGEQLTLRTVARYADYSNFMGSLEQVQRKNRILDEHCQKIGRNPDDIKRSVNINVFLGSDQQFEDLMKATGRSAEDAKGLKDVLYPRDIGELTERLLRLRDEAHIHTAIVYFPDAASGDSLERFANEVMPQFQG